MTLFRGIVASLLLSVAPSFAARATASNAHVQHSSQQTAKTGSSNARDTSVRRHASLHRRGRAYAGIALSSRDGQCSGDDGNSVIEASADGEVIGRGTASWYDTRGNGIHTSSGERFDENALTAAHSSLPLGTRVRVTVVGTNTSVIVTINDRPGTHRRIIDLSKGAARELGILDRGLATVTLTRS